MLKQGNHKGFTIIEVVITIAIGAAVMALVLNAVQGARRSQRNNARTADVSTIATAVNQFVANRNALPTAIADVNTYIDERAHYGTTQPLFEATAANLTAGDALNAHTAGNLVTVAKDDNADNVVLIGEYQCASTSQLPSALTSTLIAKGSIRQMIIVYRVEGDPNVFCNEI